MLRYFIAIREILREQPPTLEYSFLSGLLCRFFSWIFKVFFLLLKGNGNDKIIDEEAFEWFVNLFIP